MTWQQAVITKQGLALQAKLVDGQTLRFTRVVSGAGTVDADALINATDIADTKQTLTLQPPNILEGARIRVPVLLTNIGLMESYQMRQLGFFATDPDDGEILYAIAQDDVGDRIPAESEARGFTANWVYTFEFGNAANVEVQLDPSGLLSVSQLGKPGGVAQLDDHGKLHPDQLPPMDYDPAGSAQTVQEALTAHVADKNNPHGVTAAQIGLGDVDNTRDANKRVAHAVRSDNTSWADGAWDAQNLGGHPAASYLRNLGVLAVFEESGKDLVGIFHPSDSAVFINSCNKAVNIPKDLHLNNLYGGGYGRVYIHNRDVMAEIDALKTSVANGKALIASAISDKGVSTGVDASFTDMAANIRHIFTGISANNIVAAGGNMRDSIACPSVACTIIVSCGNTWGIWSWEPNTTQAVKIANGDESTHYTHVSSTGICGYIRVSGGGNNTPYGYVAYA